MVPRQTRRGVLDKGGAGGSRWCGCGPLRVQPLGGHQHLKEKIRKLPLGASPKDFAAMRERAI